MRVMASDGAVIEIFCCMFVSLDNFLVLKLEICLLASLPIHV